MIPILSKLNLVMHEDLSVKKKNKKEKVKRSSEWSNPHANITKIGSSPLQGFEYLLLTLISDHIRPLNSPMDPTNIVTQNKNSETLFYRFKFQS